MNIKFKKVFESYDVIVDNNCIGQIFSNKQYPGKTYDVMVDGVDLKRGDCWSGDFSTLAKAKKAIKDSLSSQ